MEKKINLEMLGSKDIEIKVNGDIKHTIKKEKRIIRGDDIYNIIDYSNGDTFVIEETNSDSVDVPVLKFFVELFEEIVNGLPDSDTLVEDIYLEEDSKDYYDSEDNLPF